MRPLSCEAFETLLLSTIRAGLNVPPDLFASRGVLHVHVNTPASSFDSENHVAAPISSVVLHYGKYVL